MFQDVCLTSIQVLSQLANCISAPPSSHITLYTSQDVHINSIQVPSQPHPGLEICVSSPPRLPDSRFFFVSVESHLNLGPHFASRLHPGNISPPSRSPNCILLPSKHHLKPIQVSRCVSHLHPGHFSTGGLYLSSMLVPYHPIHVSRCASQLNPGPILTPSRSRDLCFLSTQAPIFTFLLCPS